MRLKDLEAKETRLKSCWSSNLKVIPMGTAIAGMTSDADWFWPGFLQ